VLDIDAVLQPALKHPAITSVELPEMHFLEQLSEDLKDTKSAVNYFSRLDLEQSTTFSLPEVYVCGLSLIFLILRVRSLKNQLWSKDPVDILIRSGCWV